MSAGNARVLPAHPAPTLRVLHVSRPVDGGVARVVTDLVAGAPAAGLHATVACPADGRLAGVVRDLGGDVLRWEASRAPGARLPDEVRRLARLVAAVRPDVLHAHSAKAGLAARLAVRGRVPTVFQPHAWSFEATGGPAARLALHWERYAARWAARIVCVSEAERARGERAGIRGVWEVVPGGVDTVRFAPSPAPAADRRAAPPLHPALPPLPPALPPLPPLPQCLPGADGSTSAAADPERPLVVCVARLCRQKGQDVLLRAWPGVLDALPGARLVLVGEGPEAAALRAAAPASVTLAGPTVDSAAWYRAADLVVLPSRWEGMALVPLEALACGRPVLVTDVDGARESLPAGHARHCLVPPDDPGALARATVHLLRDAPLRAALGAAGRAHVLAHHDVRRTSAALACLYHRLLAGPPCEPPHGRPEPSRGRPPGAPPRHAAPRARRPADADHDTPHPASGVRRARRTRGVHHPVAGTPITP